MINIYYQHKEITRILLNHIASFHKNGKMKNNEFLFYKEIFERVSGTDKNNIGDYLGDILELCFELELPFITVIVIRIDSKYRPGSGFYEKCKELIPEYCSYDDESIFVEQHGKVIMEYHEWYKLANKLNIKTPEFFDNEKRYMEGKLIIHKEKERNRKLINEAKRIFKEKHNGNLYCEICKNNYDNLYKGLLHDFFEGHHIYPLRDIKEEHITKIDEIKIVCPNCHKVVHLNEGEIIDKNGELLIKLTK